MKKVALVTGATSGIGKAIALLYGTHGAKVIVSGRNASSGVQVVEEIISAGGTAHFIQADVSDANQCQALIQETVSVYGTLDIACNNAGMAPALIPVADYPVETWREVIDTNLNSIFYCLKYELEVMLGQSSRGTIINMASVGG